MSNVEEKSPDLSAKGLLASDSQLKGQDLSKYGKLASKDSLAKAKAALEGKKYAVEVVADKAAALKALTAKLSKEKTIFLAGSTTLSEVGFTEYLKTNPGSVKHNFKADVLAAMGKGDFQAAGAATKAGASADIHFSSVDAITEDGDFLVTDLSGSRTAGFLTAGEVVIVASSQKIVKDIAEAEERQAKYSWAVESARGRVVYAAMGFKESFRANKITISGGNPFGGNRFHFIIISGESVGF